MVLTKLYQAPVLPSSSHGVKKAAAAVVSPLPSPDVSVVHSLRSSAERPSESLNVSALKSALDALQHQPTTAADIKKNILYRRAELLLLATAHLPSFVSSLSSDAFLASLLTTSSKNKAAVPPPPSSISLLHSVLSPLSHYAATFSLDQAWEFFESNCFELTLNVLASLESISSSLPDALEADVERWQEALKKESRPSQGSFWASGTGYGTDCDSSNWTRSSSRQNKEEKDRVIASLLTTISHFLLVVSISIDPRLSSVIKMLQSSALLPYLSTTLPGMFEAEAEPSLQEALVTLVSSLAKPPFFEPLLCHPSFLPKVRAMDVIAGKVLIGSTKLEDAHEDAEVTLALSLRDVCSFFRHDSSFLLRTAQVVGEVVPQEKEEKEKEKEKEGEEEKKADSPAGSSAGSSPSLSYADSFLEEDLMFGEEDILALPSYKYLSQAKAETGISKAGMKRLLKEQASFSSVLPLHPSSSVFVRVDASRPAVLQAMITGPEGTPYQNGCFLFDVFCRTNYPACAPLVNLATTGGGSVRFNPNLYNCGKVCLSLLGTWDGAAGETWDPKMSTLLQLFVSIQSLIFVEEPYFNEPGYEEEMEDEWVIKESDAYSANIRKQTLMWGVVDVIENPPRGFEEVVRRHFEMKREEVVEQAGRWLGEDAVALGKVKAALGSL